MRVEVEDGGDDSGGHDADEDGGDDLGESGQHQQDGQHAQADQERRPDSVVEPEYKGLDLGPETLDVRREPEELGQLAHNDDEGETVHVTDLHLTREQVGDEAEASEPQPDLDERDDDSEHAGQRDGTMHVAVRQQWHEGSEDQGRDRRIRAEDEDLGGSEDRIADQTSDGRVQAGYRRQPG